MANAASFVNHQTHDNTAAPPSQTVLVLTMCSNAQHSLDPFVEKRPLGISCCFETCSTSATVADTILATTTTGIRNVAALLSVTDMANASVATGDGKTNSTDATRNAITQLAIAITAATNMECDINYKGGGSPTMEITDCDPVPKWDFQEPGARLKPWLQKLSC